MKGNFILRFQHEFYYLVELLFRVDSEEPRGTEGRLHDATDLTDKLHLLWEGPSRQRQSVTQIFKQSLENYYTPFFSHTSGIHSRWEIQTYLRRNLGPRHSSGG
jgi:hypothetical protein